MKKIMILAISAILVANVSAQEQQRECCRGKHMSKEERVEFDIKRLTNELMLSDQQAEKFATTYREYAKDMNKLFEKNAPKGAFEPGKEVSDKELDKLAKAKFEGFKELANLQSKYYDKFRKDLSARQVAKVLRLNEPFGQQPCGGQCGRHKGHHHHGPRPEGHAPASAPAQAPAPAPQAE